MLGRNCNDSEMKLCYNWYCAIFFLRKVMREAKSYYNHSIDVSKKR